VQPSDGLASFVRDTLIYDPEAAAQNASGSFTKHLAGYRSYREAIRSAAEQPIWREVDNAVLRAVASYYGYELSAGEAAARRRHGQQRSHGNARSARLVQRHAAKSSSAVPLNGAGRAVSLGGLRAHTALARQAQRAARAVPRSIRSRACAERLPPTLQSASPAIFA
jgi:hypothetical protein